jgi:hypothetical protein
MALKFVNIGDMHEYIKIYDSIVTKDAEGHLSREWVNIFGEGVSVPSFWEEGTASDATSNEAAGLSVVYNVTMRLSHKVQPTCRVYRGSDPEPYNVVSVSQLRQGAGFIRLKVRRKEAM